MRFIVFSLLALSFDFSFAQTTAYEDFKLDDQQVIYQKVFELEGISYEKLQTFFEKSPHVSGIEMKANALTFKVNNLPVDYLKFQFSQVDTPLIMQSGKYSGNVSVSIREGRYRVTFSEIMLTGEIGYKSIKEKEKLTDYASRNSGTQLSPDWCRPNMLGLLGKAFNDVFEYKGDDDDW